MWRGLSDDGTEVPASTQRNYVKFSSEVSSTKRRRSECLSSVRLNYDDEKDYEFAMSAALGNAPSGAGAGRNLFHCGEFSRLLHLAIRVDGGAQWL